MRDFPETANLNLYFYAAEEWLVANPALYTGNYEFTEDAAHFIALNSDFKHEYLVTKKNSSELSKRLFSLTASYRTAPPVYPDLAGKSIVFLGDSIIGNFRDGMSVPGIISGLTGATVYNLGYGGASASYTTQETLTLTDFVLAFYEGDTSVFSENPPAMAEFERYLANPPAPENLCFVINFGLNDYFFAAPLASEDPFDTSTYAGAIRNAVETIHQKSGESHIILCTPTFTEHAQNLPDTLALYSYADVVLSIAEELTVDTADIFYRSGIDQTNYKSYTTDNIHPNERARFLIAQNIIRKLRP